MHSQAPYRLHLPTLAATEAFAAALAGVIVAPRVIALYGDLGAGKSAFARAFIRAALQAPDLDVPSPTFTLVQHYDTASGTAIWHLDLYRLRAADEARELDIEDAFASAIALIEWPDRLGDLIPADALHLRLGIAGEGARDADLVTADETLRAVLTPLCQKDFG